MDKLLATNRESGVSYFITPQGQVYSQNFDRTIPYKAVKIERAYRIRYKEFNIVRTINVPKQYIKLYAEELLNADFHTETKKTVITMIAEIVDNDMKMPIDE